MAGKIKILAPPHAPYNPARLSSDVVYAVKGIFAGKATEHQQGLFAQWLIAEVCKKDDLPWFPGSDEGARNTDFANGKRFVALQVLRAYNMSLDKVAEMRVAEQLERGDPITEGDQVGRE